MNRLFKRLSVLVLTVVMLTGTLVGISYAGGTTTDITTVNKTAQWTDTDLTTMDITLEQDRTASDAYTPNILFVGTLCNAHSLDINTVYTALAATAQYGNVDCYLFGNGWTGGTIERTYHANISKLTLKRSSYASDSAYEAAQIAQIKKTTATYSENESTKTSNTTIGAISLIQGQHASVYDFGELFTNLSKAGTSYDYIVLEFDGLRLGHTNMTVSSTDSANMVTAYEWIKPYYEKNNVAWIITQKDDKTDDRPSSYTNKYMYNEYFFDHTQDQYVNTTPVRDCMWILSPEDIVVETDSKTGKVTSRKVVGTIDDQDKFTKRCKDTDEDTSIWVTYENAEKVKVFLDKRLAKYTVTIDDVVSPGFDVTAVKGQYSTDDGKTWTDIKANDTGSDAGKLVATIGAKDTTGTAIKGTFYLKEIYDEYCPEEGHMVRLVISAGLTETDSASRDYIFTAANGYSAETNVGDAILVNIEGPTETQKTKETPELDRFTIEYDLKGGSLGAGVTNPELYSSTSDDITLNNPTRDGYTFTGWTGGVITGTTDPEDVKNQTSVTIPTGSTGNRKYVASWEINPEFDVDKDVSFKGKTTSIADTKVNAGAELTYSVNVENTHKDASITFDVEDVVPAGLTVDTASISNGGTYSPTTGKITWSGLSLAAQASLKLTYNVTVSSDITEETAYTNKAYVSNANGKTYTGPGSENNEPGQVKLTAVPKVKLVILKNWTNEGWEAHIEDTVYINLYANGTYVDQYALNFAQKTVDLTMDALDADGKAITYTISEMSDGTATARQLASGDKLNGYKVSYSTTAPSAESEYTILTVSNSYVVKPSDLILGKKVSKSLAKKGDEFTYTLTVKNNRNWETAEAVVLEDVIPTGLTIENTTLTATGIVAGESVTTSGQTVTWTVPTLGPCQTTTLTIKVKVADSTTADAFVNQAKLKSLDGTEVTDNPPTSPETTTELINLSVEKDVSLKGETASIADSRQNAGAAVSYSLDITNSNASYDRTITFVDKLPEGLVVDTDTISDGGSYNGSNRTIKWEDLVVKAGSTVSLSFSASVPETISAETAYENKAYITEVEYGPYAGPGSANNEPGQVSFTAVPKTKIRVEKTWSDTWDSHQNDSVYINLYANEICIKQFTLNYTTQYVEESLDAVDEDGQTITYNVIEMSDGTASATRVTENNPNGDYNVKYTTTAPKTTGGATVYTIANNYEVKPSDLTLGKTTSKTLIKEGEEYTYTLTVKNNRTYEDATYVVIEDVIPNGLTVATPALSISRAAAGERVTVSGQKVLWGLTSLAAGQTATLEIKVTAPTGVVAAEYCNQSKLIMLNGKKVSEDTPVTSPEVKTYLRNYTVKVEWYNSQGTLINDSQTTDSSKISLLKNGEVCETVTLTYNGSKADKGWSYTFEELPIYDENNQLISYTVTQEPVTDYKTSVTADEDTRSEKYGYTSTTIKNTKGIAVTYHFVGEAPEGSTLPESVAMETNTAYTSSKAYGSPAGYSFSGWYTNSNFAEENKYTDGTLLNENLDLYGKWIPVSNYTVNKDVKFNGQSIKDQTIQANRTVTYYISTTNNNPAATMTAQVFDGLPEGLTIIESSISDGGVYDAAAGKITWNLEIASGATRTVSFNASIPATLSSVTTFENKAYVEKSNGETYVPSPDVDGPGSADDPSKVSFKAIPVVAVTLTKDWSDQWISHASETVKINIYKNGEFFETVELDYITPSRTLYLDSLTETGEEIYYTYKEFSTVDSTKDVAKGEMNGLYRFEFTESTDQAVSIENVTISVSNNYQIRPVDLTFDKKADAQAKAGESFDYTIKVTNERGYETAEDVVVEDIVPAGLTVVSSELAETDKLEKDATNGQKYTWTIGSIGPKQTATLKLTVKVADETTAAEFKNTANIIAIGGTKCPEPKASPEAKTIVRKFTANIIWQGSDGKPVSDTTGLGPVTVTLKQNGVKYGDSVVISKEDNWIYIWSTLPLYDEQGNPYNYTVEEEAIEGYTTTIDYTEKSETYGNAEADIINRLQTKTVNYEYIGDDIPAGAAAPASETRDYGTSYNSADKPDMTGAPNKYYNFYGWFTDDECTIPYVEGTVLNDANVPTGILTIYGKWVRKQVTVIVVPPEQGPEVEYPEDEVVNEGEKTSRSDESDPNDDYVFEGYYYDPDFTKPADLENLILDDETVPNGELKLYPKWTRKPIVSYKFVNEIPRGALLPTSDKLVPGTVYTAKTDVGTVVSYTFGGWYLDEALTKPYTATEINEDIVLYGKWTEKPVVSMGDTAQVSSWLGAELIAVIGLLGAAIVRLTVKKKARKR